MTRTQRITLGIVVLGGIAAVAGWVFKQTPAMAGGIAIVGFGG